jgi:hypothetical protein
VIRRLAVLAAASVLAVLPAATAEAKIAPYPVPCTGCSYIASAACKMPTPGWDDWITGFVRFDITPKGRVHVHTVSWLGSDWNGAEALDRVQAYVRLSGGGKRVTPVRVWGPAGREGYWKRVNKQNGQTAQGLEVVFEAWSEGESCTTTVTPRSIPKFSASPSAQSSAGAVKAVPASRTWV